MVWSMGYPTHFRPMDWNLENFISKMQSQRYMHKLHTLILYTGSCTRSYEYMYGIQYTVGYAQTHRYITLCVAKKKRTDSDWFSQYTEFRAILDRNSINCSGPNEIIMIFLWTLATSRSVRSLHLKEKLDVSTRRAQRTYRSCFQFPYAIAHTICPINWLTVLHILKRRETYKVYRLCAMWLRNAMSGTASFLQLYSLLGLTADLHFD